jgi:hypothetical protein
MQINGKRVVDATRRAKIVITKRDTIKGDNKNPSGCAAARAAKRTLPDCISARVHIGRIYIEQKKQWLRYFTPRSLRTEIIAFDRGGTFQPGEYVLRTPSDSQREDVRQAARKRGGNAASRNKLGPSETKSPRKIRVAMIKRHNVTGIRPKGAVK